MDPTGRRQRAVHQFVPRLEPRDATGNHTVLLQESLRGAGWRSEIFVHETLPVTSGLTSPFEEYEAQADPSDVLVYQFSTASPLADLLHPYRRQLVIDYHNVTPPELYEDWDPGIAAALRTARRQLRRLAPRSLMGVADSSYNREDLVAAGCRRTEVAPVLFELDRGTADTEPIGTRRRASRAQGGARWLFVGRVVPPKAQHRLLMALWAYRRLYDPSARLQLVGAAGHRLYEGAVGELARALDLDHAIDVVRDADEPTLASSYRQADVFVSVSEHEGFGIPLVEAMAAGTPVVALGAGAVGETVGRGALVLESAEPTRVAAAVARVLSDDALRERLVTAGSQRSACFHLAVTRQTMLDALVAAATGME